jgi:hypothetical protein
LYDFLIVEYIPGRSDKVTAVSHYSSRQPVFKAATRYSTPYLLFELSVSEASRQPPTQRVVPGAQDKDLGGAFVDPCPDLLFAKHLPISEGLELPRKHPVEPPVEGCHAWRLHPPHGPFSGHARGDKQILGRLYQAGRIKPFMPGLALSVNRFRATLAAVRLGLYFFTHNSRGSHFHTRILIVSSSQWAHKYPGFG